MEKKQKIVDQVDLANFLNIPAGRIPTADEFKIFKKKISPVINLDLTNYKNTQMERRITSLMHRHGIDNLHAYFEILNTNAERLEEFINMLTINVSEFFRNPEKFMELETTYLPELLKKKNNLKIWSAGCSIGAEIYSVAMILDKLKALDRCELLASDFDRKILKKAQEGIYSKLEVGTVQPGYEKYFKKIDDSGDKFQIDPRLIANIKFERCDLLNSRFQAGFDLVLCRNVVIYFTEEAKERLYKEFYNCMSPGGILFIGSTERINSYKELGFNIRSPFFYQK